jgi:Fe-S-cluster-containing hydrogenase component 2
VKVLMVDKTKCTGCHQCELWCGTEIASVSKELYQAINEDPHPIPRVFCGGERLCPPLRGEHGRRNEV